MKKITILLSSIVLMLGACMNEKGPLPKKVVVACDTPVLYTATIKAIIDTKCATAGCHDGLSQDDFKSYAAVKLRVDNGELRNRALTLKDMPQVGSPALTDDEMTQIDCWIKQGGAQ